MNYHYFLTPVVSKTFIDWGGEPRALRLDARCFLGPANKLLHPPPPIPPFLPHSATLGDLGVLHQRSNKQDMPRIATHGFTHTLYHVCIVCHKQNPLYVALARPEYVEVTMYKHLALIGLT